MRLRVSLSIYRYGSADAGERSEWAICGNRLLGISLMS